MNITKELIKIFTDWTKLKIRIHVSDRVIYPKKREIWWASLGQNIGVEINGKNDKFERPVLVIKVFNKDFILAVPISSKIKEGRYYFNIKNIEEIDNVIVLSQIKSISTKRLKRLIGEVSQEDFELIRSKIKDFI
jgi:mRNA interferase MazF